MSGCLRYLPLREKHIEYGAKWGQFGPWEVPLYYSSILEEHEAVRKRAGLFDISHMGKFIFEGPGAAAFLDGFLPRPIQKMDQGKALYMPLLNPGGKIIDDIILYRLGESRFLMIVNAANTEKDFRWIQSKLPCSAAFIFQNPSDEYGLLALQGPKSVRILQQAFGSKSVPPLQYYEAKLWDWGVIARTGYTGEDGFEFMFHCSKLAEAWEKLFRAGAGEGLCPAGFGARDTLRLEAAMRLYGHEMNEETSPLEAGIEWAVDWDKESFEGREPLSKEKKEGSAKRLAGFEMVDRGIPRQDCAIQKGGRILGKVTSGSFSPTLKKNIGLGYVPAAEAFAGNRIEVVIRHKPAQAQIVKLPFYHRPKSNP